MWLPRTTSGLWWRLPRTTASRRGVREAPLRVSPAPCLACCVNRLPGRGGSEHPLNHLSLPTRLDSLFWC